MPNFDSSPRAVSALKSLDILERHNQIEMASSSNAPSTGAETDGCWDFRIVFKPKRGHVMTATKAIPRGTRIFTESPAALIEEHDRAKILERQMSSNLDPEQRIRLFILSETFDNHKIARLMTAKSFCESKVVKAGLFDKASCIKHSCFANAYAAWNSTLSKLTVHADRPIKKNEEITITYVNPATTPSERWKLLKDEWGFTCECRDCCRPPANIIESERRIRRVQELEKAFLDAYRLDPTGVEIVSEERPTLADVHEICDIATTEVMGSAWVAYTYLDAFIMVIAEGDQARARFFLRRAYEEAYQVMGEDNQQVRSIAAYMISPASHPMFEKAADPRWKTNANEGPVSNTPHRMLREDEDKWLWRLT